MPVLQQCALLKHYIPASVKASVRQTVHSTNKCLDVSPVDGATDMDAPEDMLLVDENMSDKLIR